jgi:hypothetical protein
MATWWQPPGELGSDRRANLRLNRKTCIRRAASEAQQGFGRGERGLALVGHGQPDFGVPHPGGGIMGRPPRRRPWVPIPPMWRSSIFGQLVSVLLLVVFLLPGKAAGRSSPAPLRSSPSEAKLGDRSADSVERVNPPNASTISEDSDSMGRNEQRR